MENDTQRGGRGNIEGRKLEENQQETIHMTDHKEQAQNETNLSRRTDRPQQQDVLANKEESFPTQCSQDETANDTSPETQSFKKRNADQNIEMRRLEQENSGIKSGNRENTSNNKTPDALTDNNNLENDTPRSDQENFECVKLEGYEKETTDATDDIEPTQIENNLSERTERRQEKNSFGKQIESSEIQYSEGETVNVTPTEMQPFEKKFTDQSVKMWQLQIENIDLKEINKLLEEENNQLHLMNMKPVFDYQFQGLELFKRIQELEEENKILTDTVQHLVLEKNERESENQQIKKENNELEERNQRLQKANENIKTEIRRYKEEKDKLFNDFQELQKTNDNMRIEIRQHEVEKDKLRKDLQEILQENDSMKIEIQRHKEEKDKLCSDLQELQKVNDRMKIKIRQDKAERERICNDLQELQKDNDNMKIEIQQHKERISKLNGNLQKPWVETSGTVSISKEILGRGSYATVYAGEYHGTNVAVKIMHPAILSPHHTKLVEREINIASQCRHPN